jgi:ABC-type dipeptide/oligopeptide/nickel transport system ATPase component
MNEESNSIPAIRGMDLEIHEGEIVGILGESGSGKSTLAAAIMGLLPSKAHVQGSLRYQDKDLLTLKESEYRRIRGKQFALISQEPGLALSPYLCAGAQIQDVLRAHDVRRSSRRERCQQILDDMQFADVSRIYHAYPHQLSGGELHRVAVAQALACHPSLMICDEATRSLDATIQLEIIHLLKRINGELGTAFVFITHNPALLEGFAYRVLVMYRGRIVEQGLVSEVFRKPGHPYTRSLVDFAFGTTQRNQTGRKRLPITFSEETSEPSCYQHGD